MTPFDRPNGKCRFWQFGEINTQSPKWGLSGPEQHGDEVGRHSTDDHDVKVNAVHLVEPCNQQQ